MSDLIENRVSSLMLARIKTLQLFHEIRRQLSHGINEVEARKLALKISSDLGVAKHWHQPYIRFGSGTALSFHAPLQQANQMTINEPYSIDLGPVWVIDQKEFEGDYGDTFVLGENLEAQKCINFTRAIFLEARDRWRAEGLTGSQVYQHIQLAAERAGYEMGSDFNGHLISDFPHQQYTKARLNQIDQVPDASTWILEIQINDRGGRYGAFFEDLLS